MNLRTDRVGVLLDQLESSRGFSQARLEGLADDEYLWEPAPGAWSIRPRDQARTAKAYGPGDWVLDFDSPEPDPAPLTTIAWRLGHLASQFAGRWEWTFGGRRQEPKTLVDFTPSAALALDRLWPLVDRWRDSIAAMTDEQLDVPGFGQYPYGLDPGLPFIGIVWWTNREFIHHTAEVALLRDLWRARRPHPGSGRH
jgi:DinB superfamily